MRRKIFLALTLLFAEPALPIGRIGNGAKLRDSADRYSTEVPANFASVTAIENDGVLLDSGLYTSVPPRPVDIQILPLRTQYPQFAKFNRSEIVQFLKRSTGIVYTELQVPNGALSMIGENDSNYVGVSSCGGTRGFVLLAAKLSLTKEAFEFILAKTDYEGSCSN